MQATTDDVHDVVDEMRLYLQWTGLLQDYADAYTRQFLIESSRTSCSDGMSQDSEAAAFANLMARYDAWLKYLASHVSGASTDSETDLLASRLRPVLADHPEVFLQRENLPESVRNAFTLGSVSVEHPKKSDKAQTHQPVSELMPMFRLDFWKSIVKDFTSSADKPRNGK